MGIQGQAIGILLRNGTFGVVLLFLMLTGTGTASDGGGAAGSRFCSGPMLHDYERPLRGLPRLTGIPRSGRLPFGPTNVHLWRWLLPANMGHVVAGFGSIGYYFEGPARAVSVNWNVVSSLAQVDRSGVPIQSIAESRKLVERLPIENGSDFALSVPAMPGFYRYDILISDGSGELLGHYGEYIRVIRRKLAIRINVHPRVLSPGDVIYSRVENRGSMTVTYTKSYTLQRRVGQSWRVVNWPPGTPILSPRYTFLGPGMTSECLRVHLPSHLRPGHYRLARDLGKISSVGSQGQVRRTISFRIRDLG
jgi:Bacterial Ig-like domain